MKKHDLSKYYPPGYNYEKWNSFAISALVILMFAILIAYSDRFSDAYSELDWNRYHTEILSGRVKMQPFAEMLRGSLSLFWIFAAYCVLWGVMMRASFSQYSNSIYIMKRLESRKELIRRCAAAPAVLFAAGLLLCIVAILLMRLHYNAKVPPMCMPPAGSFGLADFLRAFIL